MKWLPEKEAQLANKQGMQSRSVLLYVFDLGFVSMARLARFSHAVAGLAILLCGRAIQFLGL